jgi:chitobiase/beta-hexosaminidase-like protein
MRRHACIAMLVGITLFAGLACQAALGYWSGAGTAGAGTGTAGAATLSQGSAPTTGENGSANVFVKWGSSSLSNGVPADGYIVKRFGAETGIEEPIGAGCAGTVTATSCEVRETPVGNWEYSVTPMFAQSWRGTEGLRSGAINTGPGWMALSRELFGGTVAPLPSVLTASVSAFGPNEAIDVLLDGTVRLASSPSQVEADGNGKVSITLPAGTSDGPHTLSIRSNGAEASAGILVDNTAPTIKIVLDPPANAAGWNNTAPVEVSGTVNDGTGSGLAFVKYTTDGSDPKTSPTSIYASKPVSVTESGTAKFYLTDNAGNQSPVETQQVKIDTTPPFFTVDFVELEGGAYIAEANEATGEPGEAFYRGAGSGSFRFLMTPVPLGGSPALSAGFSALPADAIGFSFDTSTVKTPIGGPFLSSVFSWNAGTTSTPGGTISLSNEAGSTFGSAGLIHNDSTAPSAGSVDAVGLVGRYSASLKLSLALAKGTDSGSGLADGTGPSDLPAKLLRATAPLTSDGVSNGSCGTYSTFAQVGSDNPAPSLTDTVPADDTCYAYRYLVSDHVGNLATYTSPDIKVQTTAAASLRPTNAVLTPVSGTSSQSISGSTVFYNPARLGSFDATTSASSPYSGLARVDFPALGGFSGGGAVASPISGTTYRTTYAWSANGANPSPGVKQISATNNAGQTSTNPTAFNVVKDDIAPTTGSVDATGLSGTGGRYSRSRTLSIALAPGGDAGAGLAVSGAQLLRASATLTYNALAEGSCGAFGAFAQVGGNDPATPKGDIVPADRTCYRYQYLVPDKVGNQAAYLSPEIKVDVSPPPAPTLSFSALTNAFWSGTGTTVFYRPGAGSGGFQVNASSTDPAGVASYGFPTLPAGWSSTAGAFGSHSYSWTLANPTAPVGPEPVGATSKSGGAASASFTATPDAAAPTGGSVTTVDGYWTGTTVSVIHENGTDALSGVNSASGILEGATATLSAGGCETFGAFVLAATNPTSPYSFAVTTGTCYKARYLISDHLGNQAAYLGAGTIKVDTVPPTDSLSLADAVNASMTASTIYYRGNVNGSFEIVDAVADAASGPGSATFPAISTTGWAHNVETISTPVAGPYVSTEYSWTASPAFPTAKTVIGRDAAGLAANASVTFTSDVTAPTGVNISYTNGVVSPSSIAITTNNGNDPGSGINLATVKIKRDSTTLVSGSCGSFPGTYSTTVTLVGGADTNVTRGNCYRYQYIVADHVGNVTTFNSASVAKF